MLSVNRACVLVAAALAVASPFAGAALMRAHGDGNALGVGVVLLNWPQLLIAQLPPRIGGVLMLSGLLPLLLYFGAYLLACHAARQLWRRIR
jgi:hypothetical protein